MAGKDRDPSVDDGSSSFVDRDDDGSPGFVDRDYETEFPGDSDASEDATAPDPGYAAFAGELDDPLANWPSPDASLTDLPEVRLRDEALTTPASTPLDAAFKPLTDDIAGGTGDFGDTPDPEPSMDMAFDDDIGTPETPDRVDDDTSPVPPEPVPVSVAPAPPAAPPAADTDSWSAPLQRDPTAMDSTDNGPDAGGTPPPTPASGPDSLSEPEPEPEPEVMYDEELVDDFLNDLDDPDTDYSEGEYLNPEPSSPREVTTELPPLNAETSPGSSDSSVETMGAAALAAAGAQANSTEPEVPPRPDSSEQAEGGMRNLPWGMIAVIILALALLGFGGYGVVKQRGELEAEIRNLQAQLATTVSPEEAEQDRERQRQMELRNESLGAEVEALTAENTALGEQLRSLEEKLGERIAQAEAEAQAAEEAAARARAAAAQREKEARAAAQAATRSSSSRPGANAEGPWFVNFGSYAQKNVADRWAAELTVQDGRVVVQNATAAGKTLYRVRVVGLATQDKAERVATALERQYQLPRLWVGKN